MEATLNKWGNGQGVLLSKVLCDALGIEIGDKLDIEEENGTITIKPLNQRYRRTRKISADELFSTWDGTYTPPNDWPITGNEVDWGTPVGKEVW